MSYESAYINLIKSLSKNLPIRKDGRIDYTTARKAPVLTIFIRFNKKILLLKRSQEVLTYKGKWNTVAGYLDQLRPLDEKVKEELSEELGFNEKDITSYYLGSTYSFDDEEIQKTWVIFPVLVDLNDKPKIVLDWEHTDYKWIYPEEIDQYDTVPNAKKSLRYALESLK
jgi:isopentenyldiphosphate isomerase